MWSFTGIPLSFNVLIFFFTILCVTKYLQKEKRRNPKTDTKKQFPRRVTTSLKLLPRKKTTKNNFFRSTKWLSTFLFNQTILEIKGVGLWLAMGVLPHSTLTHDPRVKIFQIDGGDQWSQSEKCSRCRRIPDKFGFRFRYEPFPYHHRGLSPTFGGGGKVIPPKDI